MCAGWRDRSWRTYVRTCVWPSALRTYGPEERPLTAVMFKHGNATGPDAGKKIKESIRAKACTYVRTNQLLFTVHLRMYVRTRGRTYIPAYVRSFTGLASGTPLRRT